MLRKGLSSLLLIFFFLFLSFGNLFRLAESSLFSDNLIVSEAILYVLSFLNLLFLVIPRRLLSKVCLASALIGLSFIYGCSFQGFDLHAGLYALRLVFLLFSIVVVSEVCFEKFNGDISLFFLFLFKAYALSLFLGTLLYFFFPEAEKLWIFLKDYHVGFQGDPHMGRFVSVYFDPNYYASIAGLVFLIASYLYEVTKKIRYQLGAFVFFLSGVFTWSRSGIFILMLLLLYRIAPALAKGVFKRKNFLFGSICIMLSMWAASFYLEEVEVFLYRTVHFFEEDSALCRLKTFQFGISLLELFPFFGVGINFLYKYAQEGLLLNSLDSSLLSILVQIGLIPFFLLTAYVFFKALSFFKIRNLWKKKEIGAPHFFSWFCFYALGIGLFASQFNNLLFYPFWIMPFGVICLFVIKRLKNEAVPLKIESSSLRKKGHCSVVEGEIRSIF